MNYDKYQHLRDALAEWLDKTDWVQINGIDPRYLGMHRADILRDQIEKLTAERDALREALAIARHYVAADLDYLRDEYVGFGTARRVKETEGDLARVDAALEESK